LSLLNLRLLLLLLLGLFGGFLLLRRLWLRLDGGQLNWLLGSNGFLLARSPRNSQEIVVLALGEVIEGVLSALLDLLGGSRPGLNLLEWKVRGEG